MANDKQIESHHRKHHRSSSPSEETDKSTKRHKHRHHKHHHHRHRHHRDKKRDDEIPITGDETEVMDVTPAAPIGVSNGREEDVEEGEILEEERIGDVLMKTTDSDGESGEIKSDRFQDNNLPPLGKKGRQGEEEISNGFLTRESEREDKRLYKEAGDTSERVSKRSYDNGRSSFSSESSEEKHKTSNQSPSNTRLSNEVRARSRSRSHGQRELSRSRHHVVEDEIAVRGRNRDSSRDSHHDRVDTGRMEEKYHRRGRYEEDDRQYSREVLERERSKEINMDREGSIRDRESEGSKRRERDSDWRREREREKRREIDAPRERRKEKEREISIDRDRRREREGDYLRNRDNETGRSRDRTRYNSRERKREKERESEKDREKGREIPTDKEKYRNGDVDDSGMRHRQSRYDAVDDLKMRRPNFLKAHNNKGDKSEEKWGNDERSPNEDGKDDNDKVVIWKSPEEEEEEELNRIKEKSRKIMADILEKHKKKPEQQNELFSQDVVQQTGAPESASSAVVIAANVGQAKANLDFDADVAKGSLIAGGPPTLSEISDSEKTQAPAWLGEGSPKSEGSADMFHDDIFGESPAGIQKVRLTLHHDIEERILEKVPVKSLLRFKAVSKQWKSTIESPFFKGRQLKHREESGDRDVLMVSSCNLPEIESLKTLVLGSSSSVKIPTPWDKENIRYFVSYNSCDGLVCLYSPIKSGFIVNPATRWYLPLPLCRFQELVINLEEEASLELVDGLFRLGFGKDISTGTYKIVWLYNSSEIGLENATTCEVFDFTTNSWRYVTPASPFPIVHYVNPVFVDGSLHWFTACEETKLVSFDLHTEVFQVISKAPFTNTDPSDIVLCNLNNRLCVSKKMWPFQLIWSFNSGNKTWDKICSINLEMTDLYFDSPTGFVFYPIALLDWKGKNNNKKKKNNKKKDLLFYDPVRKDRLLIHDTEVRYEISAFKDQSIGYPVCYFQSLISI